jgi:hypothetical protein
MSETHLPLDLYTAETVQYAVTVAGQLVYGSTPQLDQLGSEVRRILDREMRKEVGDQVAADGSNGTLTVSGETLAVRIDPTSALRRD